MNNVDQPGTPPVVTPGVPPVAVPPVAVAPVAAPPVVVVAPAVAASVAVAPVVAPVAVAPAVVPVAGVAPVGYTPGAPPVTGAPPVGPAPIVSDPSLDGDTLSAAPVTTPEQIQAEFDSSQQGAKGPEYAKMVLKQGDNYLRLIALYKKIKIHWIQGDDGNTRPYLCGDNCGICDVISPFMSFTLVEASPGSGKKMRRKYVFEDINAALSKKITGDSFAGQQGWTGKERTLFNCIDRMDNWCIENNHTKVLAYSDKAIGIGGGCSDDIWQIAKEYGGLDRFDIKIGRAGLQRNTKYTVMLRANGMFELTAAEQGYKIYNLEKIAAAYPDPAGILTDAPNAIKEAIGFLTLQGIVQQSPSLMAIAEKLGINAAATQPIAIPAPAPIAGQPPVAAPPIVVPPVAAPPVAATPIAAPPATAVTPAAQPPTTLAPEVPAEIPVAAPIAAPPVAAPVAGTPGGPAPVPATPVAEGTPPAAAAGTKKCDRCGDQNSLADAKQCSFCGALFPQ